MNLFKGEVSLINKNNKQYLKNIEATSLREKIGYEVKNQFY